MSWNRAEREAAQAASAIFALVGWKVEEAVGGKHKLLVVTLPSGRQHRFPLSGTPAGGATAAARLAQFEARKLVRRHGSALEAMRI